MLGLRRPVRVQTDRTSIELEAGTTFSQTVKWTSALDVRDYDKVAVFFLPSFIPTNVPEIEFVVQWSDDGSTIPFSGGDNLQQTDFNILDFTDGSFNPKPYIAWLTVTKGTLVVGATPSYRTFTLPVGGGFMRVGVRIVAGTETGTYAIRAQRLVTRRHR